MIFSEKVKTLLCAEKFSAPCVYKKFNAKQGEKAVIQIVGLGFFELFVNGKRVGEDYFKPLVTDYSDRDFGKYAYPLNDKTSHSVAYCEYEITDYVKDGDNLLTVLLGNGYYRQKMRLAEGDTSFGNALSCAFAIAVGDKVYYSCGDELCAESFIRSNNLFYGELHDYKHCDLTEFIGKIPKTAEAVKIGEPYSNLFRSECPCDRIIRYIEPTLVSEKDGKKIFDIGENTSGFVVLHPVSEKVSLRYAERLVNGELDFSTAGGDNQIYENTFLNAEKIAEAHAWFSWGCFRYFELEGEADGVKVAVVHSDVKQRFYFESDNSTLNWLFDAYIRTQSANMHCCIPMDCSHRERLGYTGDGQLTAETAMLCFDAQTFYEKWIKDIAECQDVNSGHIQHTAPFFGGGGGPGGWGCAIVNVPYAYYKVCGDDFVLKKYFTNMTKYLDCMDGFSENGLIVKERDGGWCLGDWCAPSDIEISEAFVNTYFYVKSMRQVEEIARIIGEKVNYGERITQSENALIKKYFNENTGDFCDNAQGANAFALLLGLGNERTKRNFIERYERSKHFDTGIFGTDVVSECLVKLERVDLLIEILSQNDFPSFGYMKACGSTTIWEWWKDFASLAHPMKGACVKQLLYGILGVSMEAGEYKISKKLPFIENLRYVKAKWITPTGQVLFDYRYKDGQVIPQVTFSVSE